MLANLIAKLNARIADTDSKIADLERQPAADRDWEAVTRLRETRRVMIVVRDELVAIDAEENANG